MGHSNKLSRRDVLRNRQLAKRFRYFVIAVCALIYWQGVIYFYQFFADESRARQIAYLLVAAICGVYLVLLAGEIAYRASLGAHRGQRRTDRPRRFLHRNTEHGHIDNAGKLFNHNHPGGDSDHNHEGTTKLFLADPWPAHYFLDETEK